MEEEAGQGEYFWGMGCELLGTGLCVREPGGSKTGSALKKTGKNRQKFGFCSFS